MLPEEAAKQQDEAPLLDYRIDTDPAQVRTSETATLRIVIENLHLAPVTIDTVTVTLPTGTAPYDLTASFGNIDPVLPAGWKPTSPDDGTFVLTPPSGTTIAGGDAATLIFENILVNDTPGECTLTIEELASNASQPVAVCRFPPLPPIEKWPQWFHLSDLIADPTEVQGARTRLAWTGSATTSTDAPVTYALSYDPDGTGPVYPPNIGHTGPFTSVPLTNPSGVVVFYLTATYVVPPASSPTTVSRTFPVTVKMPPPVITSFTVSIDPISDDVTLSWDVENVTSCAISNNPNRLNASDTWTFTPTTVTSYTLTAENSAGQASASLSTSVGSLAGAPVPVGSPCEVILTRDGSWAYVAADCSVYVVDTNLLTTRWYPTIVGFQDPSQPQFMLLSPDESRLYVIGPQADTPDPDPITPPGSSSYIVAMFDTDTMAPTPPIAISPPDPVGSAALSPDGKELYLTFFSPGWTEDQQLLVYDAATFAQPKSLDTGGVVSSRWAVAVGPDGTVYCLNPAETVSELNAAGTGFTELFATTSVPLCAVFSTGQTHITLGEAIGNTSSFSVETYDLNPPHTRLATTTFPVATLINSRQPIVAASDGFWLLLADGQLRKLDPDSLTVVASQSFATPVIDFAVSADGAKIAVLSAAGLSIIDATSALQATSDFEERALRDAESLS